jgi:hypothetical protein
MAILLEKLSAVAEAGHALLRRARELNERVGRRVFPQSIEEVACILLAQLKGARRGAEIADSAQLMLPPLDEHLVLQVLAEAPDEIEIGGEQIPVQYIGSGSTERARPQVRIQYTPEQAAAGAYLNLPDGGVVLPDGTPVELVVYYNGNLYDWTSGTNVPLLKQSVGQKLNALKWDAFKRAHNQDVTLPDPNKPDSVVADIVELAGDHGVTGPVFGTVEAVGCYRPYFQVLWFTDRSNAEAAREAAISKLAEYKEEIKRMESRLAAARTPSYQSSSLGLNPYSVRSTGLGRSPSRSTGYGYSAVSSMRRMRWGKKGPGADAPSTKFKAAQARMLELAEDKDVQDAGLLSTKLKMLGAQARPKGEDALKKWLDDNMNVLDRAETVVEEKRHERQLAEMQPKLVALTERLIESDGSNEQALQDASNMLERVEQLIQEGKSAASSDTTESQDEDESDNASKIDEAYGLMSELEALVDAACNSAN